MPEHSAALDDRPPLPRTLFDWLLVFGPGAIVASLTIGTGELIFSSRGGAIFGYRILFAFALISVLKWGLVVAISRHMVLSGVHPYKRFLDLPGPRGWVLILLLMLAAVCLPIWVSFHSSVLGNMTAWLTGTRDLLNGGMDYVWGGLILAGVLILTGTGGYSVLERVQLFIVGAMMFCAIIILIIYNPDWLQLLFGLVPQPLAYPDWLTAKYPDIAKYTVWEEATRYVGVIGGAGFDYLAYTSWLRDKKWGVLPEKATPQQLENIAADAVHPVRKWVRAPIIDSAISFILVVAFSAVFVATGAMILGPRHLVPNEDNFLSQQSQLFTQIHQLLLPLYVVGAYLTMGGTLYGTLEIACAIGDEIARAFATEWTVQKKRRLKRFIVAWCGSIAFAVLIWLGVRQAIPVKPVAESLESARTSASVHTATEKVANIAQDASRPKKLLLALLTPINLFTGVLSCGLICFATLWIDRFLPRQLRSPSWLIALNMFSGCVFLALGMKAYWDNENRALVIGAMLSIVALALILAVMLRGKIERAGP
jgi:Mn2+/Fe2+ NRAMP family transporter